MTKTHDTDWRDAALCALPADHPNPAAWVARWFPVHYYHHNELSSEAREAIAVCRDCPSLAPCLEWALRTRQTEGIWGGTTPTMRGLRRDRGRAA